MITCEQCGKVTGTGPVGTSWLCGDCRVGTNKPKAAEDNDSRAPTPSCAEEEPC